MADGLPEPAYIAGLATQLQHHPDLRAAEDELARIRAVITRLTGWINNPAHDITARSNLADHLGLPAPRTPKKDTP
ncbi:hypothetical protein HY68_36670 [Streptomyces sp. AcH 505]|uniref:hypothetical protein n=1 Tax=Streptomyces sp. AcH 505 TaxID=352211 RepID=UPI000591AB67|nr:hypothetical protein HY68_36670 [Streptomyces sp. AcH 505]